MSKIINPVSVIISTREINQPHIDKVRKSFSHPKTEMLVYVNNGEYSLPQIYNKGLDEYWLVECGGRKERKCSDK